VPNFGYKNASDESPAGEHRPPGNHMGLPSATPRAPAQLVPNEEIGIQNPQQQQQQAADHGGPRLPHFNLGATEGLPGMGGDAAAAGGAEAAGGADAIGELAPLALAAL
jgi:hypothetical protein